MSTAIVRGGLEEAHKVGDARIHKMTKAATRTMTTLLSPAIQDVRLTSLFAR